MAHAEVSNMVNRLLTEIRLVSIESDKSPIHQSEIFRKFALIDYLLIALDTKSSEWSEVNSLVTQERKNTQSELADLDRMPIPDLKVKATRSTQRQDYFPKYRDMPTLVRLLTMDKLSISERLRLVSAIPTEVNDLDLNLDVMRFEAVLPILLQRKRLLHYQELNVLSQVVSNFQNCINFHFEKHLSDDTLHEVRILDTEIPPQGEVGSKLKPVPMRVRISFFSHNKPDTVRQKLCHLAHVGKYIWDCSIMFSGTEILPIIQTLCDCLARLPNLRCLRASYDPPGGEIDAAELDAFELPEMPKLTFLEVSSHSNSNDIIGKKLLLKYSQQVTDLKLYPVSLVSSSGARGYSNLISLTMVDDGYMSRVPDVASSLLALSAENVQLKKIRYVSGLATDIPDSFRLLMNALNHFGNTVEELSVDFQGTESTLVFMEALAKLHHDFSWLANLNFPKVKKLEAQAIPETWAFLLQFPALEELTVDNTDSIEEAVFFKSSSNVSNRVLLSNRESLYQSKIWKLFPFLKLVKYLRAPFRPLEFEVRREECLALERQGIL